MKIQNKEVWKPVKGFEGRYEVSNLGRVKSLDYRRTGREQILKAGKTKGGYLNVCLWKYGVEKCQSVHNLVAEAFLPNPKNLPFVNHHDENFANNTVENLEWCSTYKSKRVYQYTKDTLELVKEWQNANEAQRQTGWANPSNISQCCRGKIKTAYGFVWSYTPEPIQRDLTHGSSKPVYQYTLSGDLVKEWCSAMEVQRQMGWYSTAISACCQNGYNREGNNVYKGFIWSYTPLSQPELPTEGLYLYIPFL